MKDMRDVMKGGLTSPLGVASTPAAILLKI